MRTTITLADDVSAAIDQLRRERGLGLSEAVNELIRRGLMQKQPRKAYRQRTYDLGLVIDVADVADALELVEGTDRSR